MFRNCIKLKLRPIFHRSISNQLLITSLKSNFSFLKNQPTGKKKLANESPDITKLKEAVLQAQNDKNDGKEKEKEKEEEEDNSSFFNEGKTSSYIFIASSLGLLGAYGMLQIYTIIYDKKTQKKNFKVKFSGAASIGGPWKLKDIEGNVMTHRDLKGCYYLIYFGFCNCPDICPLTLQKISRAMNMIERMPEKKYFKLKCLFVSVDPERDSNDKIKRFLELFEYKKIMGLTADKNDSPELLDIMQKFKIYSSKIYYENNGEKDKNLKNAYTIDHTIITYLMDDNNNYVNYLGSNLNENDMASNIIESILENEREKVRN